MSKLKNNLKINILPGVTVITVAAIAMSHTYRMIDNVNLTSGTLQVLQSQQRTAALSARTTENLSSARKVQSALDSPTAYYQARNLSNRASDLLAVKDRIGQGLHTIKNASVGLESLGRTIDHIRSITSGARGANAAERQAAAQLFDRVTQQLDTISSDTSYSGVSLTSGSAQDLEVVVNENGQTLVVSGTASDRAGLGIGSAVTDFNNLATDADVEAALAQLGAATASLRSREQSFATDVSILNVREQFTQELSNTLQAGANDLVAADIEKEAVNLLALQVRQKLGNVSLNLIAEKNNAIADLF